MVRPLIDVSPDRSDSKHHARRVAPPPIPSQRTLPPPVPPAYRLAAAPTASDAAPARATTTNHNSLTVLLAVIALPLFLLAVSPSLHQQLGRHAFVKAASASALDADWFTRILEAGKHSPAGLDASGLSADEALQRAEQTIFNAGQHGDLEERKFWLRKSITLLLSTPEARWAVTQLGTLHTAAPSPQQPRAYRSAKMLWELASASGDAVATCFVGQLYEFGLGVEASKERAKRWYQRAAERGGCNMRHELSTAALTR